MMRFVELTPELFIHMPVAEHLKGVATLLGSKEAIEAATQAGAALGLIEGGKIFGAGGVLPMWDGRGLCWFIPSLGMERRHYARALHRCRQELAAFQARGYVRLDCTVATELSAAIRWAERIGFVAECNMPRYGVDGRDHTMMRWEKTNA